MIEQLQELMLDLPPAQLPTGPSPQAPSAVPQFQLPGPGVSLPAPVPLDAITITPSAIAQIQDLTNCSERAAKKGFQFFHISLEL